MNGPPPELIADFFAALQRRALDACRAILDTLAATGPDDTGWHTYLRGIFAYEADHDWARAEAAFRLVITLAADPLLRARARLALGRSLDVQGHWDAALDAFAQARADFVELDLLVEEAKALKQLAITTNRAFSRGDYGPTTLVQAVTYAQQALELVAGLDQGDPAIAWLVGSIWNTLGLIHRNQGDLAAAADCYMRDLAICRANHDRYGMGLTLGNLGEIDHLRGPAFWPAARETYLEALATIRSFNEPYEEAEVLANLGFLHREMGQFDAALAWFDAALEQLERLRAAVSSDQARSGFFATVVDTYAHAVLCAVAAGDYTRAFAYLERARARAYLDLLAAEGLRGAEPTRPAGLAAIQAALPPDAVLLAYFTCGLPETLEARPWPGVQRHRFPPPRTLLFAVTREALAVHTLDLDPAALRPASLEAPVERHLLAPEIRAALYARLIAPATPLIAGRRRVFLVPHGPLHYVPFQSLIAPDGEPLLRPGGPTIVYGLSATALFAAAPARPMRFTATCLALGYNGARPRRLRFAEGEARSVAQRAAGHALVGPEPKLATLRSTAAMYRWLHFSCHGAFVPERPLTSGLQIGATERLTAQEVAARLQLNCDLVVLSACESGLSRVRRGDDLVGLVQAFLSAGAGAVLCSLWQVDELSTRILFELFYERLLVGAPPATALAAAQHTLRAMTRPQVEAITRQLITQDLLPSIFAAAPMPSVRGAGSVTDDAPGAERPYADPVFWAPFILVSGAGAGDRGSDQGSEDRQHHPS